MADDRILASKVKKKNCGSQKYIVTGWKQSAFRITSVEGLEIKLMILLRGSDVTVNRPKFSYLYFCFEVDICHLCWSAQSKNLVSLCLSPLQMSKNCQTVSDGDVLILENMGVWRTPSMTLLPGPLGFGMVVPVRVTSMSLFKNYSHSIDLVQKRNHHVVPIAWISPPVSPRLSPLSLSLHLYYQLLSAGPLDYPVSVQSCCR